MASPSLLWIGPRHIRDRSEVVKVTHKNTYPFADVTRNRRECAQIDPFFVKDPDDFWMEPGFLHNICMSSQTKGART